jgi:hypothetical protein
MARAIPTFAMILKCHLDGVLRCLGSPGDEPDLAESLRGELFDDDPSAVLDASVVNACVGA